MIRNVHRQIAEEKGVDIRFPSTANLMIDSVDRTSGNSNAFLINPRQQLIPGHFTRAAVQEVVMTWGIPNVGTITGNNAIVIESPTTVDTYSVDISGAVSEGETPIPDYYDTINLSEGESGTRNPIILVNGLPTVIIPANLPLLDPEGAPIDINGAPLIGEVLTVNLGNRFRTVASAMTSMALVATTLSTGGKVTYTITASSSFNCIMSANYTTGGASALFSYTASALATQLGLLPLPATSTTFVYPSNPFLMPWRYVDMICDQLTYCQDVKDSTTNANQKDVLHRWYFAWDDSPNYDAYGFPILQGYTSFSQRRCIAFPKQIKWDPIQTVSNLKFESFASYNVGSAFSSTSSYNYNLLPPNSSSLPWSGYEFQMTLMVSEV
jgi:hypothetical protein